MEPHTELAILLQDIEAAMRNGKLWSDEVPDGIYESTMPFAADVADFPQWLQCIFIPTLYHMIDQQLQLPEQSGISEMAKFYFSQRGKEMKHLISLLEKIDDTLCIVDTKS